MKGTIPTVEVHDRSALEVWARSMGTTVRQVDEDWQSIVFQAEAIGADGALIRCRYRHTIPRPAALRRLARTYIVGLVHETDGAQCHHVRRVIPSGDVEEEARRRAVLIATAMVDIQRHGRCGASSVNLEPYIVERAVDWQP